MHVQRSRPLPPEVSGVSPERQEQIVQQALLVVAIDLHPIHVTVSELIRQMTRDPHDFGERDRIEQAVRELAGIGLLHRHDFRNCPDALVIPTQAALRASALLDDVDEG